MNKATWINLCSLELLKLCRARRWNIHPRACLDVARMLWIECDGKRAPQIAAIREVNPLRALPAPRR